MIRKPLRLKHKSKGLRNPQAFKIHFHPQFSKTSLKPREHTTMRLIKNLLEELASTFIYDDFSENPQFAGKIYGIAQTGTEDNPTVEVYHHSSLLNSDFQKLFAPYQSDLAVKSIQTDEFHPLTKPWHGLAIRHLHTQHFGTLGGLVKNRDSEEIFILSNNHVLCNDNLGLNADEVISLADNRTIARLSQIIPLKQAPSKNHIDAGIAKILEHNEISLNDHFTAATESPQRGERVHKTGAASGLTFGTVISLNSAIRVNYGLLGVLYFENSLVIRGENLQTFSQPGDSGSLILNEKNQVVALLYAGDHQNNITFACPIEEVLKALKIRFL